MKSSISLSPPTVFGVRSQTLPLSPPPLASLAPRRQLDDWWYSGKFFFGNVKSVSDWRASNASRLFPSGLPAFSDALGLPLQLYAPFWADDFVTPYNMTESSTFKGTKLVTPRDSHAFFVDFFDLGTAQTKGRFAAFEIVHD